MNMIGAVTAGAAALAAILAGVNLYVTGQREHHKWTRDTLVELFVTFLDASFKHGSACSALLRATPGDGGPHQLHRTVLATHNVEMETVTRLRILAPARIVAAAQALIVSEHALAAAAFSKKKTLAEDDIRNLYSPVERARAEFLESARTALRVKKVAGTGNSYAFPSYREFRNLIETGQASKPEDLEGRP
jgi:hypothetical protein